MAIRTQETQVVDAVIAWVTVDVINMESDLLSAPFNELAFRAFVWTTKIDQTTT